MVRWKQVHFLRSVSSISFPEDRQIWCGWNDRVKWSSWREENFVHVEKSHFSVFQRHVTSLTQNLGSRHWYNWIICTSWYNWIICTSWYNWIIGTSCDTNALGVKCWKCLTILKVDHFNREWNDVVEKHFAKFRHVWIQFIREAEVEVIEQLNQMAKELWSWLLALSACSSTFSPSLTMTWIVSLVLGSGLMVMMIMMMVVVVILNPGGNRMSRMLIWLLDWMWLLSVVELVVVQLVNVFPPVRKIRKIESTVLKSEKIDNFCYQKKSTISSQNRQFRYRIRQFRYRIDDFVAESTILTTRGSQNTHDSKPQVLDWLWWWRVCLLAVVEVVVVRWCSVLKLVFELSSWRNCNPDRELRSVPERSRRSRSWRSWRQDFLAMETVVEALFSAVTLGKGILPVRPEVNDDLESMLLILDPKSFCARSKAASNNAIVSSSSALTYCVTCLNGDFISCGDCINGGDCISCGDCISGLVPPVLEAGLR